MKKPTVLISGSTISSDDLLCKEVQSNSVTVIKNSENHLVESIVLKNKIDLILFELDKHSNSEVSIIRRVKNKYPAIEFILINGNGNRNIIANAFAFGAKDFFKKPFNRPLLIEKVKAIIKEINM